MEDDIARQLPDPPPPRPAPRTAAITAALERFDGGDAGPSPARAAPPPSASWWRTGRGQIGALASVALVAAIGIPLAIQHQHVPTRPAAAEPATPTAVARQPDFVMALPKQIASSPSPPGAPASSARAERPPSEVAPAAPAVARIAPPSALVAPMIDLLPPPPSAPPPPPPPPPPAPAMAPPPEAFARASNATARPSPADERGRDVVVTGSRVSPQAAAAARRGDWNACTVDDPEQSLRGCKRLVNSDGDRPADTAGAALSRGLALAWQGDWGAAVEAFDRAIELQPKLGLAYLNRGLARQHLGDTRRAAADLDRAVRYDPSARSYYVRGKLRRSLANNKGARADAAHAAELDPDYAPLVDK